VSQPGDILVGEPVARWPGRRLRLSSLARQPMAGAGFAGSIGVILVALLAPVIEPYGPNAQDYNAVLVGAFDSRHLLGTDEIGRDVLSRLIEGARISMEVGVLSTLLAVAVGAALGCVAGYFRGIADALIGRSTDVVLAFPFLILAIAFAVTLGPSATNATLALAIAQAPTFIRVARGEVLGLRKLDYVQAAISIGVRDRVILARHILPGIMNSIIVQTTVAIPLAIIGEASLSFLGLGVQPPTASWGTMLSDAQDYFSRAPLLAIFPGLSIVVTALSFNLLGDGLRSVLDARRL
jgi:peptide/nickel transport system permease protein